MNVHTVGIKATERNIHYEQHNRKTTELWPEEQNISMDSIRDALPNVNSAR